MQTRSESLLMNRSRYEALYKRTETIEWLGEPLGPVYQHLANCTKEHSPDVFVVQERKGRALLRGLIDETNQFPHLCKWDSVISSTMIEAIDASKLAGKKIVLFDDTIRTGAHVTSLVNQLLKLNLEPFQIMVCVVGSHRDGNKALRRLEAKGIAVRSYFKNLSDYDFFTLRKSLVDKVRNLGSLMLDTEHVEYRFKTDASFRKVVDALGRSAGTVVFDSAKNIKNISVYYGSADKCTLQQDDYPGCGFTNIVKKCRVIRYSENEYSIIPLCLPSVPSSGFVWPDNSWQLRLFSSNQPKSGVECFYQVALAASIEVLKWAIKDLSSALRQEIIYRAPHSEWMPSSTVYDYLHLLPIYPTLDIEELNRVVVREAKDAESRGIRLSTLKKAARRRTMAWNEGYVQSQDLDSNALRLVQSVGNELRERSTEYEILGFQDPRRSSTGLRAREVFDLARGLGLPDVQVSALFDILIDSAILVTKMETVESAEGIQKCVRTFKPDGEIVTAWVEKYTREWGLATAR